MKNLLFILGFLFVGFVSSCDLGKEPEILGTNTQGTAGEWVVALYDTAYVQLTAEDIITTSNTSANLPTEMWFIDHAFFVLQTKVTTDQTTKTISCTDSENLEYAIDSPDPTEIVELGSTSEIGSSTPNKVTINGGILSGLANPPSGATTDSMHLTILANYVVDVYTAESYEIDGQDTTVIWNKTSSYDTPDGPYHIVGHRRTGFLEDEPH